MVELKPVAFGREGGDENRGGRAGGAGLGVWISGVGAEWKGGRLN